MRSDLIEFNSREKDCKEPYGAVPAGTEVRFSVYTESTNYFDAAELLIGADGQELQRIPLEWDGVTAGRDCYTAVFAPEKPGLYWYTFSFVYHGEVGYLNRTSGGRGMLQPGSGERFQLTVYNGEYQVARWFGKGITYHIFPDRFARTEIPEETGYRSGDRAVHKDWRDIPVYLPNEKGEILNNDFFGGSIRGVISKLDYLKGIHVQTIYFNPIFEAFSNHRYDTGCYKRIDPMFGTEEEFTELCWEAEKRGMRVILDGVFSHTGYDSEYFNARGHYESLGAFQSKRSPYYDWYEFSKWPNEYSSWWGIYTLPQVREMNEKYLDYMIEDDDSVIRRWLRLGASGWRLDVADELPDEFIQKLNSYARKEKQDALIIGEVWEDASNKISYDVRRKYFQGGELDSVMNYPLRDGILAFLGGAPAESFAETIMTLQENYPHDVFYNLMNIIGTHDTPRALTVLGGDAEAWNRDRTYRAQAHLTGNALIAAREKMYIASVIQFTMPGSPTIYYGDEVGLQGYEDPFNRRGFPWGDEDGSLQSFYQKLCAVRAESEALNDGELRFLYALESILVYERATAEERILIAVNVSDIGARCKLEKFSGVDLLTNERVSASEEGVFDIPAKRALIIRCDGKKKVAE